MYCPRCAAQNMDDARFCRACGADISLVPQALVGQLPEALYDAGASRVETRRERRRRLRNTENATVEKGIEGLIIAVGWLLVSLSVRAFAPAGRLWFFWLLIPAFISFAGGISALVRARRRQRENALNAMPSGGALHTGARLDAFPSRGHTSEIVQPTSITEGTTRHLVGRDENLR